MIKSVISIFLFLFTLQSFAQNDSTKTEDFDTGIIYGPSHAYALTAPKGWVLDNSSGVNQGLHAVFYPADESWNSSPVVAYSRAILKNDKVNSIEDVVNNTLSDFKNNGSENVKSKFVKELKIENKKSKIFDFTGDRWGNFERVGYIDENKSVILIVLSARTLESFKSSSESLNELLASYKFITEDVKY